MSEYMSLPSLRMRPWYGSLRLFMRGNSARTSGGLVSRYSSTARSSSLRTAPDATCTFHGWMLVPDGARDASTRSSSTSARGTGSGLKARTDLRACSASIRCKARYSYSAAARVPAPCSSKSAGFGFCVAFQ